MKIWDGLEQRSEAWFRARAGRPTASAFSNIVTPTGRDSSKWDDYATELSVQCLMPTVPVDGFMGNHHTDRGNELEPVARKAFADATGKDVREVGFCVREDGVVGASPDGLIYEAGEPVAGLEIKCPVPVGHGKTVASGKPPEKYLPQIHGGMAVTGLDSWWFVSYCEGLKLFSVEVKRDAFTEKISHALDRFLVFYADHRAKLLPNLQLQDLL